MKTAAALYSLLSWTLALRYGLAVTLVCIGMLKFTRHEAEAIRPLAESSPFFSWAFRLVSTRMFSTIVGVCEISTGILIALRPLSPKLSALGSISAAIAFLVILSFMVSGPMHLDKGLKIPFTEHSPLQFFIIHTLLLGASILTAFEALAADRVA